jgi:parvulin-like peptidyl-prolyl isomerase
MNTLCRFFLTSVCVLTWLTAFSPLVTAQSSSKNATPDPYFRAKQSVESPTQRLPLGGRNYSVDDLSSGHRSTSNDASIIRSTTQAGATANQTLRTVNHTSDTEAFAPGRVLALVGGEPIFVGDMMFQINQMIEQNIADAPEDVKQKQREMLIPKMLPQFVESKLLYQGAIAKLPDEVDVEGVIKQAGSEFDTKALPKMLESSGVKDAAEFDAQLRGQNSSLRQLRRSWAIQQLTRYFVGEKIATPKEVTHQEMLEVYQKSLAKYEKPARAKWEQVMIRFDRSTSQADAKKEIIELGNQIVYGANLSAVAKKSSHGYLASFGGTHDWTTKGNLVLKQIDDAIFTLPVGELSDLIETKDGYHIVRVTEREEESRTPFLEAQVDIKKQIEEERRKAAFEEYVKELKRDIPVEYLVNE